MNRRRFLYGLTASSALTLTGAAAFAATYADAVVSQLTKQGFYNIAVQTTLLGRVRILADRGDGQREIILNPRTGEILRDTWMASGSANAKPIIDDIKEDSGGDDPGGDYAGGDDSGGGGSGNGGDDSGSGSGGDDQGGDDQGDDDQGGGNGNSGQGGSDNSGNDDGNKDDDKRGKDD